MTKRVLVTGSSKGIGKAIALRLANDGFDVVVHCRGDRDAANEVVDKIKALGQKSYCLQFDVANRLKTREILEQELTDNGPFYGVVCNAGITRDTAFPAMTESEWDDVVHTNLDAIYNVLHPLVMPMVRSRKGGRIVTMASVSGVIGNRGQVNYSASKAGVIGLTKSIGKELAGFDIACNCVTPAAARTPIFDQLSEEFIEYMLSKIPRNRFLEVDEVASMIGWMVSPENSFTTGAVFDLSGGRATY